MLTTMNYLNRHGFNTVLSFSIFVISALLLEQFLLPFGLLIGSYIVSNKAMLTWQKHKKSKMLGFTRTEYNHIEQQIKEAKQGLSQLMQQYTRVRSVRSFKMINEMNKLAKRIINIVQTNPQKFYAVEDFFYSHLPSTIQLVDKYTLLTKEQVGGTEVHLALEDTRKTLKQLYATMEEDLKLALSSDIEHLKLELDYVKLENQKKKDRMIGGE